VLDARDPLGTRCRSVEKYLREEAPHKHLVFVINKTDLVPTSVAVSHRPVLTPVHVFLDHLAFQCLKSGYSSFFFCGMHPLRRWEIDIHLPLPRFSDWCRMVPRLGGRQGNRTCSIRVEDNHHITGWLVAVFLVMFQTCRVFLLSC
jgi:hypothetical protein